MLKILKAALKNYLTVFLVIALIVIFGAKSYKAMPIEVFPDIKVPYVFVNTFYLGVAPKDIETLVTNPIEKKLKNIKGLEKIRSISRESLSSIFIEFSPNVDIDQALQKVKDKVDTAKPDLPKDIEEPMVNEFSFENFPFIYINVFGPLDLVRLKKVADKLKDELEKVDGVLEVSVIGGQDREIQIVLNPAKMQEKGLSYNDIARAIQAENINIPGGSIDIGKARYSVRIPGEFAKVEDLQGIIIKSFQGSPVYLQDVAEIQDTFKDQSSYSRFNGKSNISISLTKRSGANLLKVSEGVKKSANGFIKKQNIPGLEASFLNDQSIEIRNMVAEMENHAVTGFILVILVLFLFLGFRNAFLVSLAIPFSMLLSFIVLNAMGYTLNMIVLFSLILVLGLLADDAIVVVENIYRYLEEGKPLKTAAYEATNEVAIPVITSTLTTLAAFIPLLAWQGMMGEFMKYLPVTVIVTMTSSLLVAFFINPVLGSKLMKLSTQRTAQSRFSARLNQFGEALMVNYEKLLRLALNHSARAISLTLGFMFISLVLFGIFSGIRGVTFFPDQTPTSAYVNVTLPGSSVLADTDEISGQISKYFAKYPDIKEYSENIGGQSGGFSSGETNPNKAQIAIEFNRRHIDVLPKHFDPRKTIESLRKDLAVIPGAVIEVTKPQEGPPRGAPVSIRLAGEDFDKLRNVSKQIQEIMKSVKGLVNVKDDYDEGQPEIVLYLDRGKMSMLGLSTAAVASTVRAAIYGSKVSTYRDKLDGEEYDITVRFPQTDRQDIQDIQNINVTNYQGNNIPLSVFSTMEFAQGIGYIQHREFERVIEVSAENAKGKNAQALRKQVQVLLDKQLPKDDSYTISFTGEQEEQNKASGFLSNAFLITVFLIFLILVAQFHSFMVPFIILGTIVLSLVGIFWGLMLTWTPFCIIMTGVGVISLAGIVVKNGILLLDFTVRSLDTGMSRVEALVHAGKVRVRPVLLTAATAILGLLPMSTGISIDFHKFMIVTKSDMSEWWASMSNAVIFGLAIATMLTLIVVPCLFNILEIWKEEVAQLPKRFNLGQKSVSVVTFERRMLALIINVVSFFVFVKVLYILFGIFGLSILVVGFGVEPLKVVYWYGLFLLFLVAQWPLFQRGYTVGTLLTTLKVLAGDSIAKEMLIFKRVFFVVTLIFIGLFIGSLTPIKPLGFGLAGLVIIINYLPYWFGKKHQPLYEHYSETRLIREYIPVKPIAEKPAKTKAK